MKLCGDICTISVGVRAIAPEDAYLHLLFCCRMSCDQKLLTWCKTAVFHCDNTPFFIIDINVNRCKILLGQNENKKWGLKVFFV